MPVTQNHTVSSSRLKALIFKLPLTLVTVFAVMLVGTAAAQAKLAAPKLQSPGNKAADTSMPAFEWRAVSRAASYQFEFSATKNFSSAVAGWAAGPITLSTTAITNDQTIPNGTYYWRARAVSKTDVPGAWSKMRTLREKWVAAPALSSPVNTTTVNWPTTPLTLDWKTIAGAVNYNVEIATNPAMSDPIYGPTEVQGPNFVIPNELAPNTYYWTVQPVNGSGVDGTKSKAASFTLNWPSTTTLTETDSSPDSTYEEPTFSWTPIPGAASYELEVSTDPSYPANAIILDPSSLISTNYDPTQFFPNHTTLYWRVRAHDLDGDAGAWNAGQSFTETFDLGLPTIQNLHVVDGSGNILDGSLTPTSDPIIRWSPVPGASSYTVTFAQWVSNATATNPNATGGYCDYNDGAKTTTTTQTALTPLGTGDNSAWESSEYGWPSSANNAGGISYQIDPGQELPTCVSVIAQRDDAPITGSTILSAPTVLGSGAAPAFVYLQPAASADPPVEPDPVGASTYTGPGAGIASPTYGSPLEATGTLTTSPLFQWQPVANAAGYYVIIANDEQFDPNSIVAGAYTVQTSWVPEVSLNDQNAAYWWEVIPVDTAGQPEFNAEGSYDPQQFNKQSVPPTPVSPVNGANVGTLPVFTWHSAQGARNYTIQISADSSFANPIETDETDATQFTSSSTLPPGETLYWRVRANDDDNSLNWSPTQTFTHNLPTPTPLASNPTTGSSIPMLAWSPVTAASSYNLKITSGTNVTTLAVDTPYMTPSELLAPGLSTYQVQSVFPGGATSAYSSAISYKRTIPSPSGIKASKSGARVLIKWKSDPIAKSYTIQLSTTPGFSSPIANDNTQNFAWVPQIPAADVNLKLYWRIAAVDYAGNTGGWHDGVFKGKKAKKAKKSTSTKKKTTKKKKK